MLATKTMATASNVRVMSTPDVISSDSHWRFTGGTEQRRRTDVRAVRLVGAFRADEQRCKRTQIQTARGRQRLVFAFSYIAAGRLRRPSNGPLPSLWIFVA